MDKQTPLKPKKKRSATKEEFQSLWKDQVRADNLSVVANVLHTPKPTVSHWNYGIRRVPGIAIAALNMWREIILLRKLLGQIRKTIDMSDKNPLGALARVDRLLADAKIEGTTLDDHNSPD